MNEKYILIVAPDCPYPPNHGGRLDIWNRIMIFAELGYCIDLLVTYKEEHIESDYINEMHKYIREIYQLKRNNFTKLLGYKPYQIASRTKLKNAEIFRHYNILLLESEYVSDVLSNSSITYDKCILRVHNDEPAYFINLAKSTSNIISKFFYYTEFLKFRLIQKAIYRKINDFLFISMDEKKYYENKYNIKNCYYLPPYVGLKNVLAKKECCKFNVLFVGSLFMPNNIEGIVWYLNNVHLRLIDYDEYTFTIVGNANGADLRKLNNAIEMTIAPERISLVLSPKELVPFYEKADVFINPMFHGAGIKMKNLDAISYGLPIVTTTHGAKGMGFIDGEHLLVADIAEEFASALIKLKIDKMLYSRITQAAHDHVYTKHNPKDILTDML